MAAIWLLILGVVFFTAGYALYGGFLSRKLGIDPDRVTPAHSKRDGVDYVPAKPAVLVGHHFASIAGAAPIIGPVTAAVFGWLPVYIWIVLGGIFLGAAHDFMSLVASIRHEGKSIGEVVEEQIGPTGKILFLLFAWSALILVIAVFADVVASTFVKVPAVATSSLGFIALALVFGVVVNRFQAPLWMATVVGVVLLVGLLFLGQVYPFDLAGMLGGEPAEGPRAPPPPGGGGPGSARSRAQPSQLQRPCCPPDGRGGSQSGPNCVRRYRTEAIFNTPLDGTLTSAAGAQTSPAGQRLETTRRPPASTLWAGVCRSPRTTRSENTASLRRLHGCRRPVLRTDCRW